MGGPKIVNGVRVWGLKTPEEAAADKALYNIDLVIFTDQFSKMTDEEVLVSDEGLGPEGIWVNPAYVDAREQALKGRGLWDEYRRRCDAAIQAQLRDTK